MKLCGIKPNDGQTEISSNEISLYSNEIIEEGYIPGTRKMELLEDSKKKINGKIFMLDNWSSRKERYYNRYRIFL